MTHPSLLESDGWCAMFLAALPVDHVAISTIGDPFETATVASSDGVAAALTELQLDRGEGPGWRAAATHRQVLTPHLAASRPWPTLVGMLAEHRIASSYAFPMTVGVVVIGAVDLYARTADALSRSDVDTARGLTSTVTLQVLRDAVQYRDDPDAPAAAGRRVVHQATGMVMAQMQASPEDALLVIRGHAYAEGRSVRDVALDIVDRRIDFSDDRA